MRAARDHCRVSAACGQPASCRWAAQGQGTGRQTQSTGSDQVRPPAGSLTPVSRKCAQCTWCCQSPASPYRASASWQQHEDMAETAGNKTGANSPEGLSWGPGPRKWWANRPLGVLGSPSLAVCFSRAARPSQLLGHKGGTRVPAPGCLAPRAHRAKPINTSGGLGSLPWLFVNEHTAKGRTGHTAGRAATEGHRHT